MATSTWLGSAESAIRPQATVCATFQPGGPAGLKTAQVGEMLAALLDDSLGVSELRAADDRRRGERALTGKRVEVDRQPRLAIGSKHREQLDALGANVGGVSPGQE